MNPRFHARTLRFQGGATAVEAAVIMAIVLIPVLAYVLFFGRYFWYYNVAQKAAHDAALYMSGAPVTEMKGTAGAALAQQIIFQETGDVDSGTAVYPDAVCGYKLSPSSSYLTFFGCNPAKSPNAVRATVVMTVSDPFFPALTSGFTGQDGMMIMVAATVPYVGH
jgi:Flp pilus assembly protein TadG